MKLIFRKKTKNIRGCSSARSHKRTRSRSDKTGTDWSEHLPLVLNKIFGVVVQLVRTPACHAGGREFEPRQPRLIKNPPNPEDFSLYSCSASLHPKRYSHRFCGKYRLIIRFYEFLSCNGIFYAHIFDFIPF